MKVDFLNLSRGIACASHVAGVRYCRIQSTACEQRLWPSVIYGAGVDLAVALATGMDITIHDESERPRYTRALWQGVPALRHFAGRAWGIPSGKAIMRNGHDASGYFDEQWGRMDDSTKRWLRYFGRFVSVDAVPVVRFCAGPRWGYTIEVDP